MRKKLLKWFTLVEILIVIGIIGILIWALVPRMSAAQWRARDVARKNDLAQLQSAIVTSQQDKWRWPCMTGSTACSWAEDGVWINELSSLLQTAWMNSIPHDPLQSNQVTWLGSETAKIDAWEYGYMVWTRNWTPNAGFILMAKTEVEWWSNRVVCNTGTKDKDHWYIGKSADLWKLHLCTSLEKKADADTCTVNADDWKCIYREDWELRYILLY